MQKRLGNREACCELLNGIEAAYGKNVKAFGISFATSFNLCRDRQFSSVKTLILCCVSISSESRCDFLRGLSVARTRLSPASGLLFSSINCQPTHKDNELGSLAVEWQKYLWDKDQTKGRSWAKDDEDGDDDKRCILLITQDEGQASADHAHDHLHHVHHGTKKKLSFPLSATLLDTYDVVNTHSDVLGVIEGRNGNMPRLPRQENAKSLSSEQIHFHLIWNRSRA